MNARIKRHVVLTAARSGSNHLVAAMNQHSNLCNFGEVLGPWTIPGKLAVPLLKVGGSQAAVLEKIYSSASIFYAAQGISFLSRKRKRKPTHFRRRKQIHSIGVKEFFLHLRKPSVFPWFQQCENLSIIYLRREDLLARALSVLRLNLDDRPISSDGDPFASEIYIAPEELFEALNALVSEAQDEHHMLEGLAHHRILNLVHEISLCDWEATQNTLTRVHSFLGVEPRPISNTGHRSALKGKAIESVRNREEIERLLMDSEHAQLLELHR